MKLFRIASQLQIEIPPSVSVVYQQGGKEGELVGDEDVVRSLITDGLKHFVERFNPGSFESLSRRYRFVLKDIKQNPRETNFQLDILPLGNDNGIEEMVQPGDPMYDFYSKYRGGKTGRILYKSPQEALASIPRFDDMAYRGMSWEEWRNIEDNGIIQSRGAYNIGQEGLTFFSRKPDSAAYYASGFAPLSHQVSRKAPGVVIGVDSFHLLTHKDREDIPEGELALLGSMQADKIKKVWFLVVTSSTKGEIDLLIPWDLTRSTWTYFLAPEKSREGTRITPSFSYAIIEKK